MQLLSRKRSRLFAIISHSLQESVRRYKNNVTIIVKCSRFMETTYIYI